MKANMSPAQRKFAMHMTNYDGDDLALSDELESNFSEEELMELVGSDLMSFDGTFADQRAANRVITMKIVGNASADDTLYLNPDSSILETDNGHPISGKGIAGNAMTITASPGSLERLYRWLEQVPSSCMGIRIKCADPVQIMENFIITQFNNGPFDNGLSRTITTSNYTNERDNRDDMVTVPEPMFFDRNTRIEYKVAKGTTVMLTLNFGARLDLVKSAQKAVQRALNSKMKGAKVRPSLARR